MFIACHGHKSNSFLSLQCWIWDSLHFHQRAKQRELILVPSTHLLSRPPLVGLPSARRRNHSRREGGHFSSSSREPIIVTIGAEAFGTAWDRAARDPSHQRCDAKRHQNNIRLCLVVIFLNHLILTRIDNRSVIHHVTEPAVRTRAIRIGIDPHLGFFEGLVRAANTVRTSHGILKMARLIKCQAVLLITHRMHRIKRDERARLEIAASVQAEPVDLGWTDCCGIDYI